MYVSSRHSKSLVWNSSSCSRKSGIGYSQRIVSKSPSSPEGCETKRRSAPGRGVRGRNVAASARRPTQKEGGLTLAGASIRTASRNGVRGLESTMNRLPPRTCSTTPSSPGRGRNGRARSLLPPHRRRSRRLPRRLRGPPPGPAQGPDRLRQDALRRAHGAPALPRGARQRATPLDRAAAGHRRLPRGPDGVRPGGALPAHRRRDGVDRRAAHARGAHRRDLLPRRDRRGAQGHHRPHPSAHRPPPHAADREERRRSSRRTRTSCSSSRTTRATRACSRISSLRRDSGSCRSSSTIRRPRSRRASSRTRAASIWRPRPTWRPSARRCASLREHGFEEGASTRLLVYTAQLVAQGIDVQRACEVAISRAITDDREVQRAVAELVTTIFP